MKRFKRFLIIFVIIIGGLFVFGLKRTGSHCLVGSFIADKPTKKDIKKFQENFGKKPYLVMVFIDWENFVNEDVITDIYSEDCVLLVTWEPWHATDKQGLDYNEIISGEWDRYIKEFAEVLKNIDKVVYLRFAHEMNGNWYPWSGQKIGREKYIAIYRHMKDVFDKAGTSNVKWIFSVNWEDVPEENNFINSYPGDEYVDFIGLDGYNWGNTKPWSRWMSFKEIFQKRYQDIATRFKKPIIITEFSTTSSGGNKSAWIREAMSNIKKMEKIKAFILFNVDKETDWSFPINKESGRELRLQFKDSYFRDKGGLDD